MQTLRDLTGPGRAKPTCCKSGMQSKNCIYVVPTGMRSFLAELAQEEPQALRAMRINPTTTTLCGGCIWKLTGGWSELGGQRLLTRYQAYTLMGLDPGDQRARAKLNMLDDMNEPGTPLHPKAQEMRGRHGPPEGV